VRGVRAGGNQANMENVSPQFKIEEEAPGDEPCPGPTDACLSPRQSCVSSGRSMSVMPDSGGRSMSVMPDSGGRTMSCAFEGP